MPKHRKCFTLESYHHGAGEVYRFICSDECGAIQTMTRYGDKTSQAPKGMALGIIPSNLEKITALLIQSIKNNQSKTFERILSRNFIYPNGKVSTSSWHSSFHSNKWGRDIYHICSAQPVYEVIQFSPTHKKEIFSAISKMSNKGEFSQIFKAKVKESLAKLNHYQDKRLAQEKYTGFSWGFSKQDKLAAADLLQNFYLGKVDSTTFYSKENAKSRRALQQGKLGDIYKELKSNLPGP